MLCEMFSILLLSHSALGMCICDTGVAEHRLTSESTKLKNIWKVASVALC